MFKRFTLFFVCLACASMASADYSNVKIGDLYYNLITNYSMGSSGYIRAAVLTSSPNKYSGKVVVPGTVEYEGQQYAVLVIGIDAFKDCSNLTAVELPIGIEAIYNNAFSNCGSLLSINIPEGVTHIYDAVFNNCTSLTAIELPHSLTSIGSNAFYNCTELTEIVIPDNVTEVGSWAFYSSGLRSVTIGKKVTHIYDHAFRNCTKLKEIHISDLSAWCRIVFGDNEANPCYVGHNLYLNGEEITELVIPEDITTIGQYAFYGCYDIQSVIIPNNVQSVETNAFGECYGLTHVSLGANIANLNKNAFTNCSLTSVEWNITNFIDFASATLSPFYKLRNQITSFTFGEGVEHIPAFLCREMSNLTRIDIPASVTSVGEGAFAFCTRLTEINAAAGSPLYTSVDGILFNKDKTSLIIYPAGKSATSYAVPEGVQTIEENAFYGCSNLASVSVPASVTTIKVGNSVIPQWSFEGSTPASIVEGVFASDVYLIVDDVEAYKAAWPEYASRIFPREHAEKNLALTAKSDKSALHMAIGDANLENVIKLTISGTINSYDLMIMRNKMINLRELDLTEASIEASPYEYYTGYCSHADSLNSYSFRGLVSLKLPKTLKYVMDAITECSNLKYLEINGGVVGANMAPSTNLEVVLNEGVTAIEEYAFSGRTGLRKITINCPITAIPDKAFWNCTGLQEVLLPATLETIGVSAFEGTALTQIVIPASVKRIEKRAFAAKGSGDSYHNDSRYYKNAYRYKGTSLTKESSSSFKDMKLQKVYFDYENPQLEYIGDYAFYRCSIDTLNIRANVSYIGNYAFYGCYNLRCITFNENSKLTAIGEGVFQECPSIGHLSFPKSVLSIGDVAFLLYENSGADAPTEVFLPEAFTTIGRGAFYGRANMSSVHFPNTLISIEQDAFSYCAALKTLSFPTSLQTIGNFAFQGCSGLDEIKVPSTLRHVGDYAFSDCSNVTKVYTYTVEPVSIDQNTFSCWHNADLYVPTTSYYTYYYNTQWSQFLSLKQFDEEYEYFYINNDYELGGGNGTIGGDPNADLNENSGLIVTGDEQQGLGVITIMGDGVNAGSIIACEENLSADSLIIRILTQKGQWNYFCFPFDMLLEQLHFAHQYAIREYDGATRAQYGAGGWINMVGDMIHAGLGYIFQGAQTDTLEIVVPNPKISCQDYEQIIQAFNSDDAVHANWNFIGNPYPSWYDLDFLFAGGFSSPIYIWNASIQDYQVYKPGDDEYHFHPYEGFFTQNPGSTDMHIIWGSDGRETKTQADDKQHGHHMPRKAARVARQQNDNRKLINLQLASESYTDRTRIVFNDAARMEYELGKDAVVMDGGQAPLHIWSLNDDKRLSINERPYATGQVSLGYYVKEDGFYTLSASRMDTAVVIFDNELNQEVDLAAGDYVFYTDAGTNNTRFSIIRIKEQTEQTTAIEDVVNADEPVTVYTLLGAKLYDNVRRADLHLNAGVYIIEKKDGARTELTIQ